MSKRDNMTSERLKELRNVISDPFMGWPEKHFVHELMAEIDRLDGVLRGFSGFDRVPSLDMNTADDLAWHKEWRLGVKAEAKAAIRRDTPALAASVSEKKT